MTGFESIVPRSPAPSRRNRCRILDLAAWAAFAVTVFVFCFPITMVLMSVAKVSDDISLSLEFVVKEILILPMLVELVNLLALGQWTQLVMRLFQLLKSS
jgi:hypothetical protein